jgi:multidrug transporter EmrE-like cation transporter
MLMLSKSSRLSLSLLWIGLVLSDSAAQLLFKSAAVHLAQPTPTFAWVVMVAQSWRMWSAVACLLLTFGFWMLVLRRASLSRAFPVTALTFLGIVGGSWWFFDETIAPIQYVGIAFIIAGVAALKPLDA